MKERLVQLAAQGGRGDTLVRVACHELEAWYFGDLEAVATAYGKPDIVKLGSRARYRDPDSIVQPSEELRRLVPEFQKISGARRLAPLIDVEANRSRSFQVFLDGVRRLAAELNS